MKAFLGALALLLAGCAGIYRYDTAALTAYGEKLEGSATPLYYSLAIDFEKGGSASAHTLAIRFAGADTPIALHALTPQEAAHHLPPWEPPPQWPDIVKQRERERRKAYQAYAGEGAYLSFRDGRLAYLSLCSHCEGKHFQPPQIGRADSGITYALPLTEAQLREVFGEPTRLRRQREINY